MLNLVLHSTTTPSIENGNSNIKRVIKLPPFPKSSTATLIPSSMKFIYEKDSEFPDSLLIGLNLNTVLGLVDLSTWIIKSVISFGDLKDSTSTSSSNHFNLLEIDERNNKIFLFNSLRSSIFCSKVLFTTSKAHKEMTSNYDLEKQRFIALSQLAFENEEGEIPDESQELFSRLDLLNSSSSLKDRETLLPWKKVELGEMKECGLKNPVISVKMNQNLGAGNGWSATVMNRKGISRIEIPGDVFEEEVEEGEIVAEAEEKMVESGIKLEEGEIKEEDGGSGSRDLSPTIRDIKRETLTPEPLFTPMKNPPPATNGNATTQTSTTNQGLSAGSINNEIISESEPATPTQVQGSKLSVKFENLESKGKASESEIEEAREAVASLLGDQSLSLPTKAEELEEKEAEEEVLKMMENERNFIEPTTPAKKSRSSRSRRSRSASKSTKKGRKAEVGDQLQVVSTDEQSGSESRNEDVEEEKVLETGKTVDNGDKVNLLGERFLSATSLVDTHSSSSSSASFNPVPAASSISTMEIKQEFQSMEKRLFDALSVQTRELVSTIRSDQSNFLSRMNLNRVSTPPPPLAVQSPTLSMRDGDLERLADKVNRNLIPIMKNVVQEKLHSDVKEGIHASLIRTLPVEISKMLKSREFEGLILDGLNDGFLTQMVPSIRTASIEVATQVLTPHLDHRLNSLADKIQDQIADEMLNLRKDLEKSQLEELKEMEMEMRGMQASFNSFGEKIRMLMEKNGKLEKSIGGLRDELRELKAMKGQENRGNNPVSTPIKTFNGNLGEGNGINTSSSTWGSSDPENQVYREQQQVRMQERQQQSIHSQQGLSTSPPPSSMPSSVQSSMPNSRSNPNFGHPMQPPSFSQSRSQQFPTSQSLSSPQQPVPAPQTIQSQQELPPNQPISEPLMNLEDLLLSALSAQPASRSNELLKQVIQSLYNEAVQSNSQKRKTGNDALNYLQIRINGLSQPVLLTLLHRLAVLLNPTEEGYTEFTPPIPFGLSLPVIECCSKSLNCGDESIRGHIAFVGPVIREALGKAARRVHREDGSGGKKWLDQQRLDGICGRLP